MRMILSLHLVFCLLFFGNTAPFSSANVTAEERPERPVPAYAKFGQIAMNKVKEKYPNANIIDYLHIGREKGTASSTEKFKLWLKESNKEFGVFVDITFDNATEQVTNIKYKETAR